MPSPVISVENLSKTYRLGQLSGRTLTEDLNRWWARLRRRPDPYLKIGQKDHGSQAGEYIWALKDVSFTVEQGEVLGIIGRNGAGKSTLLKILSRVTAPTSGVVRVRGRVASLLEVGTGFHPELTGRENIYLNGAILGMSRREIAGKFDEIVAFAEVEQFIDTPVKRYSSGMYVRLAFAVAAHLDPEILVVDEVLAVGDITFQKKCLGKMGDVAKSGRTVLFISHNMSSISNLCSEGLLLANGQLIIAGPVDKVVHSYIGSGVTKFNAMEYLAPIFQKRPYIKRITILQDGNISLYLRIDQPITIMFELETYGKRGLVIGVAIQNEYDICVQHSSDEFSEHKFTESSTTRECLIPSYALAPGKYFLDVSLGIRNVELFEHIQNILSFEVEFVGLMADQTQAHKWKGVCGPGLLIWR